MSLLSGLTGAERAREPMSSVDTAWLRMERPSNLMMITGVMILADPLDLEAVSDVLEKRFLSYRRFRQRPVRVGPAYFWQADADFDIAAHVHRTALPGAADKAELEAFASDLASTPLDYSKPLWQMHVIDDYQGGSALIPGSSTDDE